MLQATVGGSSGGIYQGRDIPAFIQARGARYAFEGIAVEDHDGSIAVSQLCDDELLISPGLIYRKENWSTTPG